MFPDELDNQKQRDKDDCQEEAALNKNTGKPILVLSFFQEADLTR
jgi:hypothetical protein